MVYRGVAGVPIVPLAVAPVLATQSPVALFAATATLTGDLVLSPRYRPPFDVKKSGDRRIASARADRGATSFLGM